MATAEAQVRCATRLTNYGPSHQRGLDRDLKRTRPAPVRIVSEGGHVKVAGPR